LYIDFDPANEDSSLGKYLKSIREDKEITLEELAESTKIKIDYLEAIEEDKYDNLPKGPYLTLFLKSYSEALEIDYVQIRDYLESLSSAPKPSKAKPAASKPAKEKQKPEPRKIKAGTEKPERARTENGWEMKNYLGLIGALVFIAFIAVVLIIIFSGDSKNDNHAQPAATIEHQDTTVAVDSAQILREEFLERFDSLIISVHPANQQLYSIIADGNIINKVVTPPGVYAVSAHDSLSVYCERMDESRIYLNGFRLITDAVDLAGENPIIFDRNNWINFVDTTDVE